MITYFDGTVFNAPTSAIVNTVNCVGVMGAGIALEFSLRYPDMFKDYENKCKEGFIRTGIVDYFRTSDKIVINFPTKWHFKYPSQLKWIEQGLLNFKATYKQNKITSVAFPKLGTANGGLQWEDVKVVMEKHLSDIDIPVYICLDTAPADGLEREMLDILNNLDLSNLKEHMRVTQKQRDAIERNRPFKRFWMVKELDGIGITFYSKLFIYCKRMVGENSTPRTSGIQLSLFGSI